MSGLNKGVISIAVLIATWTAGASFAVDSEVATPEEAMAKVREAAKFLHD